MRQEAEVLLIQADTEVQNGNAETATRLVEDAVAKTDQANQLDAAASEIKRLKGEYNQPTNLVPIASQDAALYDPADRTASIKSDYKPMTWIDHLPPCAQPMWVQEQMGSNLKEQAQFQKDTFEKWLRSPNDAAWMAKSTPDEQKAMQEDTDVEGGFFVPEEFIN